MASTTRHAVGEQVHKVTQRRGKGPDAAVTDDAVVPDDAAVTDAAINAAEGDE